MVMDSETTSNVSGDPGWRELEEVSQHVHIVPEKTLRQIARGPLTKLALECEDNE